MKATGIRRGRREERFALAWIRLCRMLAARAQGRDAPRRGKTWAGRPCHGAIGTAIHLPKIAHGYAGCVRGRFVSGVLRFWRFLHGQGPPLAGHVAESRAASDTCGVHPWPSNKRALALRGSAQGGRHIDRRRHDVLQLAKSAVLPCTPACRKNRICPVSKNCDRRVKRFPSPSIEHQSNKFES